jgi:hypothetical protein
MAHLKTASRSPVIPHDLSIGITNATLSAVRQVRSSLFVSVFAVAIKCSLQRE